MSHPFRRTKLAFWPYRWSWSPALVGSEAFAVGEAEHGPDFQSPTWHRKRDGHGTGSNEGDMKSWWKVILAYPPTWIAAGSLGLTVWLVMSWLDPPGMFAVVFVVLAVVAAVSWPFTMSATGTLADLQFAVPKIEEVDPQQLEELATELEWLDDSQPAEQLKAIRRKRESLAAVLRRRLDAGELTFARYLSSAQRVYMSALDNLHEVALAYQSIGSIDEEYISRRLEELDGDDPLSETAKKERSSLEGRRGLRRTQETRISQLLAQNEAAMTALDRTTTALADAPIGKTPEDAEEAMRALEELAARASKYATS